MRDISGAVPPVEIPVIPAEPALWGNTLQGTVEPGTSSLEEALSSERPD